MEFLIQVDKPGADRPALRVLRCLKRLTQKDLARQVGISQSTLARLERGLLPQDRSVCVRLADALNVKPGAIFPELEERYEPTSRYRAD